MLCRRSFALRATLPRYGRVCHDEGSALAALGHLLPRWFVMRTATHNAKQGVKLLMMDAAGRTARIPFVERTRKTAGSSRRTSSERPISLLG